MRPVSIRCGRARAGTAERGGGGPQAGFSVTEILVVLFLISMIAMVGMPPMVEWSETYQIRFAAEEIAETMRLQRQRAISNGRELSILFDAGEGTLTLFDGEPDTGTAIETEPRALGDHLSFDTVEFKDEATVFHPDGSVNNSKSDDDILRLENTQQRQFEVIVSKLTGRIRVEKVSG